MVYRIIIQKIKERRHYYWLKKMTKEAEDSLRKPGQLLDKNPSTAFSHHFNKDVGKNSSNFSYFQSGNGGKKQCGINQKSLRLPLGTLGEKRF